MNLFHHPLVTSDWELAPASPIRTDGRALWRHTGLGDRIVHARWVQGVAGPVSIRRLGLRRGIGYHKCASAREYDVPMEVRLLAAQDGALAEVGAWSIAAEPGEGQVVWFDAAVESSTVVAVIERSLIDGDWPSWNLARTGFVLDGEAPHPWQRPAFHLLEVRGNVDPAPSTSVRMVRRHDEIRVMTDRYAIGFRLRSPSLSFLAVDADGRGRTDRNLLQAGRSMDIVRAGLYPAGVYPVLRDPQAAALAQGPRLTLLDGRQPAGFFDFEASGTTTVDGPSITYDLRLGESGIRYRLAWTFDAEGFDLAVTRDGVLTGEAWSSAAWHVATNARVAPMTLLGDLVPTGQTGLVRPPATWHAPGHGSFVIEADDGVLLRSDAVRPLDTTTLELKVDETPGDDGTFRLQPTTSVRRIRFTARTPRLAPAPTGASPVVARSLDRHLVTALTFRADTGTISNNGASMHCAGSLNPIGDVVASIALAGGRPVDGVDPVVILARSVERWLAGAPGYGSGASSRGDGISIGDEYLMLGADALYGIGRLLEVIDPDWIVARAPRIDAALDAMRDRDLDGDGLIESRLRTGRSGEHQWSTTWADVVSFGWKDAWSNAVLYGALRAIAAGYRRVDRVIRAEELEAWGTTIQAAYLPTFLHDATGWLGGWRSPDGVLHDHAYPLVNGDAVATGVVDIATGRSILERLWAEFAVVGYDDFANGIPINLHPIPEADLGGVVFGLPLGGYLQGGATHHRTGGFVRALRRVGMTFEADRVLEGLATSVADDTAFGGLGSGLDWRSWDGAPSGYEGLLAEGFGFLAVPLEAD